MKHTDITNAIYNNEEVKALYLGDLLLYQRPSAPTYTDNQLVGKFSDDSTEEDWWYGTKRFVLNDMTHHSLPGPSFDLDVDVTYEKYWGFEGNEKLERIDHLPCHTNLEAMNFLFSGCTSLKSVNFNGFDSSNIDSIGGMFSGCTSLESVDLSCLNTSKFKSMASMFAGCKSLKSANLSGWDLSGIVPETPQLGCQAMFSNCTALQVVNMAGWDWTNITKASLMFANCTSLTTIIGPVYNIKVNLEPFTSPLTNASAMVFINGLDVVDEVRTLRLKKSTYDTLSEEQIATATAKGWTIAGV